MFKRKWVLLGVIVTFVITLFILFPVNSIFINSENPDTLFITRENPLHQPNIPPLVQTIHDPVVVRDVYQATISLNKFPSGVVHCPRDNGVFYTLTFKKSTRIVLTAHAYATGCNAVTFSTGSTYSTVGERGKSFWSQLAKALHITQDQL